MRRRLPLFHLSSIFYRLCGGAAIVFHKAARPNSCAATTTPHSSFLIPDFSRAATFSISTGSICRIWLDHIRQISILSLFRLVFKLQDAIIKYKQYV